MKKIISNIHTFVRALKKEKCLRGTSEGAYGTVGYFSTIIHRALSLAQSREIGLSKGFRKALGELESVPVYFNCNSRATQEIDFRIFVEAGNLILERLDRFQSQAVESEKTLLKRELVALLYRLDEVNGGLAHAPASEEQLEALVSAADLWKSSQIVFHGESLSSSDTNILREACQYPEFTRLALADKDLLEKFFSWALRDRLPVSVFIEYPALQQKINDFDLNGRISRMGAGNLKLLFAQNQELPQGVFQKIVTLPFEGRDINILDDQRYVLFRGNYSLTVHEVFEEFAKKRYGASNLEFMREGIVNWNAFLWGWWDEDIQDYHLVDLDQPEWWRQLPAFEVLSLREARKKFGNHLDGRQWNVAAISTRERATLDFEGAHSYSSLSIPLGDGRYAVFPFGKYAMEFPPSLFEALLSIGQTSPGTIAFPDENVFYTHRQRSRFSVAVSEQQGLAFLESVRQDMLLSRHGNLVYQIESENCAKWAHKKIEEIVGPHRIPNVFQMPFLNSEPHGVMAKVFAAVKVLPQSWHIPVTLFIHFVFGAYKGVWIWEEGRHIWKSLTSHAFWSDTIIYHPSMLLKQQELGLIRRGVRQGITFTKQHIHATFHGLNHKMVQFAEYVVREGMEALKKILAFFKKLLSPHEAEIPSTEHAVTESGSSLENLRSIEHIAEIRNSWAIGAALGTESALT